MGASISASLLIKLLSVGARRRVNLSTAVATLLYVSKTWAVKADQIKRLEVYMSQPLCKRDFGDFSAAIVEGILAFPLNSWL